jgi:TetR/AcrR family transcriptional regulator, fatty acid biosynthesis regulator
MPATIHTHIQLSIQMYIHARRYDVAPLANRVCLPVTQELPADSIDLPSGRKASISRDDLLAAALRLIGPHRSVSSLSLREVAREAGIAPNSFYRQFRDMDELVVALIDIAGRSLRKIVGAARHRVATQRGIVRGSVETFMEQVRADDKLLHVLLREGTVGSDAFKQAVDRELTFFEEELRSDLVRLAAAEGAVMHEPALVSKAITRLVFAMGAMAMDLPPERDRELVDQLITMVTMIISGARAMSAKSTAPAT